MPTEEEINEYEDAVEIAEDMTRRNLGGQTDKG